MCIFQGRIGSVGTHFPSLSLEPWTGFMLNMFCQKVHLYPKPLPLCSKSGLNLAKRWLFTSVIHDTNVIVDLKLLTTGTNVTWSQRCYLHRERNNLIWFKISSNGDRSSNTYMQAPFKKKTLNIGTSILFFCKFLRNTGLSKTWAYSTLKLGWFKTNAGTKIIPQNNMYLSPLIFMVTLSVFLRKLA